MIPLPFRLDRALIYPRPFIPDADEPTASDDENEPYLYYYEYLLSKTNSQLPQVISNSYGDDEQVRVVSMFL